MITGAHHAREVMSVQMPLYSVLKMLHGALLHGDAKYQQMLSNTKFYVIPVVNVDGLGEIEKLWNETGKYHERRKNMNFDKNGPLCDNPDDNGVDLNRNYPVYWDKPGGNSIDPCADNFRGAHPFSEPETRAIRDFLVPRKEEIKFVYNFHAYGNMYLWPYNGESPNTI